MVKKKWLWGKKSSEKAACETESSGSMSSPSEKCLEDQQDASKGSPSNTQSPDITSKATDSELSGEESNLSVKSSSRTLLDATIGDGTKDCLRNENPSDSSMEKDTQKQSDSQVDCGAKDISLKEDVSEISVDGTQPEQIALETSSNCKEDHENVKLLTEKLSAALVNVSLKEDLVKQHARVAEEAVAGWEEAENEVATLKQQLETAVQQKSAQEDRISHLDEALKECVRQLRLARDEQERKINQAVAEKTSELELAKSKLEEQLVELQALVETARINSPDPEVLHKLDYLERENMALRQELRSQSEELEITTIERDLSTEAAETASKQHLESIKKVARLEAECRKLKSLSRNDPKSTAVASSYVESVTDSHSDSGEQLSASESDSRKVNGFGSCELKPKRSESWASALIAELDQFKSEKVVDRGMHAPSVKIDLMDDFLEMERLAALPDGNPQAHSVHPDQASEKPVPETECRLRIELESVINQIAELEDKIEKVELEKAELGMTLGQTQSCLETSQVQLIETQMKLEQLVEELCGANEAEQFYKARAISFEREAELMSSQIKSLKDDIDRERALLVVNSSKCEELEKELAKKNEELEIQNGVISHGELKIKEKGLAQSQECLEKSQAQLREAEREAQLMSSQMESLKADLDRERAMLVAKSVKCEELENELEKKKEELEIQKSTISLGELVMKEYALAQTRESLEKSQAQLREAEREAQFMSSQMKSLKADLDKERATLVAKSVRCEELENELEKKKEELDIQKSTISLGELEKKENALAQTRESLEKSQAQLREAERETQLMSSQIKSLQADLDRERALLVATSAKCEELETELEKRKEEPDFLEMKENALAKAQESLEKSQTQLRESETQAQLMSSQIKSLKADFDRERALLVATSAKCEELENELEKRKEELDIQKCVISHGELEMKENDLAQTRECLEKSQAQLREAEKKLQDLQNELHDANEENDTLRSELDSVRMEVQSMSTQIDSLKEQMHKECTLSTELATRCKVLEKDLRQKRQELEAQQRAHTNSEMKIKQEDLTAAAGKLADCQKTIASLGSQLNSLATLEDFLIDTASIPGFSPPAPLMARRRDEPWTLHSNRTYLTEKEYEPLPNLQEGFSPFTSHNVRNTRDSPASSSSSTSSAFFMNPPGSEKSGNGFAKYFFS